MRPARIITPSNYGPKGSPITILSGPDFKPVEAWFVEEHETYLVFSYEPPTFGKHDAKRHHVISKRRVLEKCAA